MGIPAIQPYPMPSAADLPAGPADWKVDPERAVLLIHDMQKYFVDSFPKDSEPVTSLTRNVRELREHCVKHAIPVTYTAQPGSMSDRDRGLLKDFWGPGMTVSPAQREIVPGIEPEGGDQVFTKWRYSAFHRTGLLDFLRSHGRDQLIICGIYAHIGCLATAIESYTNDVETFFVSDAVADFTPEQHRMALEYTAGRCAVVLPTRTVVTQIETAPTTVETR
ncbi:isochorismatase family protein [Streptomyces sclerotialus]|uniref:isochorismatase family protein n=1 Tax=Streptomyces sclerotialus TaxID=1957 RepID=UPI0004CBED65